MQYLPLFVAWYRDTIFKLFLCTRGIKEIVSICGRERVTRPKSMKIYAYIKNINPKRSTSISRSFGFTCLTVSYPGQHPDNIFILTARSTKKIQNSTRTVLYCIVRSSIKNGCIDIFEWRRCKVRWKRTGAFIMFTMIQDDVKTSS